MKCFPLFHDFGKWIKTTEVKVTYTFKDETYVGSIKHHYRKTCSKCGISKFKMVRENVSYRIDE